MKTTLEIEDNLFIQAKKRAVELRVPLRQLVERGLRRELARPQGKIGVEKTAKIRWITHAGGLPDGVRPNDRPGMQDFLRRSP